MAIETPYGKPALMSGVRSEAQRRSQEGAPAARQWVFPPLHDAPQSLHGQLILNTGAVQRGGWEIGWAQIVGKRHSLCEDSMGASWSGLSAGIGPHDSAEQAIAVVLADGVGGGARGDVASHALVQHCLGLQHPAAGATGPYSLLAGLGLADSAVNKSLATLTTMPGAATLAAAWLDGSGSGWISRVGDARLSILQPATGLWQPLMPDQSYANLSEPPPLPEQLHAPARMVGAGLMGTPELAQFSLCPGEVLMLSSDGLHEWLRDASGLLASYTQAFSLEDLAQGMALLARGNGSDDDISVLLARKSRSNTLD
jgi:serine/threonine protein phosphatase PrpC